MRAISLALVAVLVPACGLPLVPVGEADDEPAVSDIELSVLGATTHPNVQGFTPPTGDGFVAVDFRMDNSTTTSQPIALVTFRARRAAGIETPAALTSSADDPCAEPAFLSPNASVECSVVFTVPRDDVIAALLYFPDGTHQRASASVPTVTPTTGCLPLEAGGWTAFMPSFGNATFQAAQDGCGLVLSSWADLGGDGLSGDAHPDRFGVDGDSVLLLTASGAPWESCTGRRYSSGHVGGECDFGGFIGTWDAQRE